jgi:hypothetical protein
MRKIITLLFCGLILFGITTNVHADMGPKPELKITVTHAPNEVYYLDLLVDSEYLINDPIDNSQYNPTMIEQLKSLEDEGWYPALVNGTSMRMHGELEGSLTGGKMIHQFGYHLPDRFRIIMVTASGKLTVSEVLTLESFYTALSFNATNGEITKPSLIVLYAIQITSTLIPTLILEFLILLLFKLYSKRNLIVFLIMNIITQLFLTFTVNTTLIKTGLLGAVFVLLLVEGVIWIFEILVVWKLFDKQRKTGVRIAYALVANILSFILGFVLIFIQSTWM